jgi:leucyl aminopeptidase (aminopeptidase T)
MRDQRAEALAKILVQYSTKVEEDDVCVIQGATSAEALVLAVYEEVLRAGGLPIVQMAPEEGMASYYRLASDKQLEWLAPPSLWTTRAPSPTSIRPSRRGPSRRASRSWTCR